MSEIPAELRFTKSHEWVRPEDDGSVTIGISDHAQEALGDMVFVELPEIGTHFSAGDECAVVESVKAASDIYCPLDGVVVLANRDLTDAPETVNEDPYGGGWLFRLKPDNADDLDSLLDADDYAELLEDEED